MKTKYQIDGARFTTLAEFYDEISRVLIPGADWGRNLDAFNDILRGGFGTPQAGFMLIWQNSAVSRERLGFPETIRYLEQKRTRCHPSNIPRVDAELENAKSGLGQTLFDVLVEIIEDHCAGGKQQQDGVELVLE